MYCQNCGNKVDEKAYVCVNCGVILNKNNNINTNKIVREKKNSNATGIVSIIFASISLFFCLVGFLFGDISSVGMYTEVYERFFFAIGYNFIQSLFAFIALVLSLINRKNTCNKVGLALTLVAVFLIITEFIVIIIY